MDSIMLGNGYKKKVKILLKVCKVDGKLQKLASEQLLVQLVDLLKRKLEMPGIGYKKKGRMQLKDFTMDGSL